VECRDYSGSNVAAPVAAWEQAVAFTSGLIGSVMHDGMPALLHQLWAWG
jgi:hypothetical protein